MSKVTVKQLHEAGFSIEGGDLCTAGAGSFKYEHLAPTNYDKDIFIEQLVWRDKAGMQPVGDDCWVILRESGITPGYKKCIASEVSWNDSSWHPQWKPDLEEIAQLASEESIANSEEWENGDECLVKDTKGIYIAPDWMDETQSIVALEDASAGYVNLSFVANEFISKPLTPAELAAKAREDAAYDLYREWCFKCNYAAFNFEVFMSTDLDLKAWLAIVDKTNYRVEE